MASKNLTLHHASYASESLFGKSSPFVLPHNLYYDLGSNTFTPSLHQLFALSQISGYRLTDWMRVFGFDVDDLTRLRVLLPVNRTTRLEVIVDDSNAWVEWFASRAISSLPASVVPVGQLLERAASRRVSSLSGIDSRHFIFAKLGRQDDFAFPDLLPGSIVRANPNLKPDPTFWERGTISDQFFLIEHTRGLCCCRIQPVAKNRIIPISTQLPYAQIEFRIPEEATILGVVDLEISSLLKPDQSEVPADLTRQWRPEPLQRSEMKLGQLLRHGRTRMALSFREASTLTRQIANNLRSQQYFASPGSLSDYEAFESPPRHIHKAISLCAIYGLEFPVFLKAAGLPIEEAGSELMPDHLLGRPSPASPPSKSDALKIDDDLLRHLLKDWDGQIPVFLHDSFGPLSGISKLSLHDVFWIDRRQSQVDPNLKGVFLAIVNRRKKTAVHWKSRPLWQQPVYVVLKRDGVYVCAFGSFQNGTLLLHSYAHGYHRAERLRHPDEAEIVGQIVALARRVI
ncbi:MAG: hypothetical protein JST79_18030 [Acidobacteria bacterium]|nr:hypothetical protein [Acidobacteriota bacterium]